jgi:hypothetical protein
MLNCSSLPVAIEADAVVTALKRIAADLAGEVRAPRSFKDAAGTRPTGSSTNSTGQC